MSGKLALYIPFLLFAAQSQAACVTDAVPEDCRVEGAKHLAPAVSEAQICEAFRTGLASALGDGGNVDGLQVQLAISGEGTMDAIVTDASGASATPYPNVSIDVMDRPMTLGDVENLAKTVAKLIKVE